MTYEMRVFCSNCNKLSNVNIEKGTPKEDVIDEMECIHCGVVGDCEYS